MKELSLKKIAIFVVLVFLLSIIFYIVYLTICFSRIEYIYKNGTILDSNNEVVEEIVHPQYGDFCFISLEEVSQNFQQVLLLSEDQSFYYNLGVSPAAIVRAMIANLKNKQIVQWASTISQQLAKFLLQEGKGTRNYNRWLRKWEETALAVGLNIKYSKEQILEAYINKLYFANLRYGVQAASQFYFGKKAQYLTVEESLLLVAIIKNPTVYNPLTNLDNNLTLAQKIWAEINFTPDKKLQWSELLNINYNRSQAAHFWELVKQEAKQILGEELFYSGVNIYTNYDLNVHQTVQKIQRESLQKIAHKNVQNGAVLVIDRRDNSLKAMLGSQDFYNKEIDGQVNVLLQPRQIGSTIKPFLYLYALSNWFGPATLLDDFNSSFTGEQGNYHPQNYNYQDNGWVTLRQALSNSLNIATVNLLNNLKNFHSFLQTEFAFDLPEKENFYGLSLGLGSNNLALYQLAQAYLQIANLGEKRTLVIIVKIEDLSGKILYQKTDNSNNRNNFSIIKSVYRQILIDILSDNTSRIASFGLENSLDLKRPAAVKTGTTREFRDNYTIGFTPQYLTAVWVGNNDNSSMKEVSGISGAGPIWLEVMNYLHQGLPKEELVDLKDIEKKEFCLDFKCWQKYNDYWLPEFKEPFYFVKTTQSETSHFWKILAPQNQEVYQLGPNSQQLIFKATWEVKWYLNNVYLNTGQKLLWDMQKGSHQLQACIKGECQTVMFGVK